MVTFNKLWENHPTITGEDAPCSKNGKPNFSNQCAIRLGVALQKSGVDTRKMPGVRHCWQHKKAEGHILAAEELSKSLNNFKVQGIQTAQSINPKTYKTDLAGQTGIILFKDYWTRRGETNPTGDHIDLWNGSRITDWRSWLRIRFDVVIPGVWEDLKKSNEITF